MFRSDTMSNSHFIAQTNKFLLIDNTAVTLGQGKVMERSSSTFPHTHILFCQISKVLAHRVLTWEGKVFGFYGGGRGGRGGNELKT